MRITKELSLWVAAGLAAFAIACGGAANTTPNTNVNTANLNKATASPTSTPTPAGDPATSFSLATPTDAYKTAWSLREKKDVEGLKKVMSKDVMEFFEMIAKDEKKTVEEEMAQMFEKPQAKTAEARNEKISGNTATVEYLDADGSWKQMDFVKEGSDWKMTMPHMDKQEAPK